MIEIEAPDGSIVEFPEGTGDDVITSVMAKEYPKERTWGEWAKTAPEAIGESAKQGGTFGGADELQALMAAHSAKSVLQKPDWLGNPQKQVEFGPLYGQALDELRTERDTARQSHPYLSAATEVGAGIATGVGALNALKGANTARTIGTAGQEAVRGGMAGFGAGGLSGAAYGFGTGEGSAQNRLASAGVSGALGGVLGAGLGAAGGALTGSLASRAAKLLEIRRARQAGQTPAPVETTAINKIVERLRADYPDEAQFQEALQRFQAGEATLGELGGQRTKDIAIGAAQYPSGKAVTQEYFYGKQPAPGQAPQGGALDAARQNVTQAIEKNISGNQDYFGTLDDIYKRGIEKSKPAYEKAFDGGSIAPLKTQYENEWVKAGAESAAARKELLAAERELTFSSAKKQAAGNNVYANSSANKGLLNVNSKIESARKKLEEATNKQNLAAKMMKSAQSDAENKVPGAIWSPRINQFLEQPEVKSGIQRGLKIQRLEAVAQGKKFDPTEFAITGTDEAGEPIVSKTPNMRLLDAGKRGLDAMIQDETNPMTGRVTELGRALIQTKQAYLDEIDKINPSYKTARAASGDYLSNAAALRAGREFKGNSKQIARDFKKLGETEQQSYRSGVVQNIREQADRVRDTGNVHGKIFGTPETRAKLKAILPEKEFKQLENDLWASDRIYKFRDQVLGNSTTASKQISAQEFAQDQVLQDLASGRPVQAATGAATRWIRKRFDGLSDKTAGEVAKILTAQNESDRWKIIRQIYDAQSPEKAAKESGSNALQIYYQLEDMVKPFRGKASGITGGDLASKPLRPEE